MNVDEVCMTHALDEARKAFDLGEVPVGAVLVLNGEVIARAHNLVESLSNATAHAEMLCIHHGSQFFEDWRLLDTTLYTTLEPCSMCMGALLLARVKRVVWGAPDLRHGAHGSFVNLLEKPHPTHLLEIEGHVMEAESAQLMRDFFAQRREKESVNT